MEDTLKELGHLVLGSRLKRLAERLQTDTQAYLSQRGITIPAAQLPVLSVLDRMGPLNIGDIAEALGMAQPGITRSVSKLEASGYLHSEPDTRDRRIRMVRLSPKGQDMMTNATQQIWPNIEAAVAEACQNLSGSLLEQISTLETALDAASIATRASAHQSGDIDHAAL